MARDWARWGRDRDYIWSHARAAGGRTFTRFAGELRAYAISDDGFAPEASVRALVKMYPATAGEVRVVRPREIGQERLGHFGFFRERAKAPLWEECAEFLLG